MTCGGRDERLRIMFGKTDAGCWWDNDSETRTGIIMGYSNGAGSKLDGTENEKIDESRGRLDRWFHLDIRKGYSA